MKTRIISSLIMVPLLGLVFLGGIPLFVAVAVISLIAMHEFYKGFEHMNIHPMRIGEGKLIIASTDEEGTHETSTEYKLESNQLLVTDEEGVESVFEKLEDGNLVMSIFLPSEDGSTMNCVSFFLVHPAE